MSSAVFPSLIGLGWDISFAPRFNTFKHISVSGRELRGSYMFYPLYDIVLNYQLLRSDAVNLEWQTLLGLFLACNGSLNNFLFTNWKDNSVVDMQFGVGDGVTTGFQLTRSLGAGGNVFVDPVQNVNVLTNIKISGTPTGAYSINSTGFVTFSSAPGAAAPLTWTGSYYYRVRFGDDTIELMNFMNDFWELKKLNLTGAPGNKV